MSCPVSLLCHCHDVTIWRLPEDKPLCQVIYSAIPLLNAQWSSYHALFCLFLFFYLFIAFYCFSGFIVICTAPIFHRYLFRCFMSFLTDIQQFNLEYINLILDRCSIILSMSLIYSCILFHALTLVCHVASSAKCPVWCDVMNVYMWSVGLWKLNCASGINKVLWIWIWCVSCSGVAETKRQMGVSSINWE